MGVLDWLGKVGIGLGDVGIIILIIMSLVEITPIKLNPWSKIASWLGKALSKGYSEKITEIEKVVKELNTKIDTLSSDVEIVDGKVKELNTKIDTLSSDVEVVDGKVKDLAEDVQANREESDKRMIIQARIRILRFCDELMLGKKHTKDSYDQVMCDITDYEHYCEEHPDFKNGQTASTVNYITESYQERLKNHDFL